MSFLASTRRLGALVSCCALVSLARAETTLKEEIEQQYRTARRDWQTAGTNLAAQLRFGETAFAWADTVQTSSEREAIAEESVSALRRTVRDHPESGMAHYYLAMNMGQLARTRTLGALKLVGEMEVEFKAAIRLDPAIHFSGPDRNLGQLYHFAPGWPLSLGDPVLARRHLDAAVKRAPDFPANRLSLVALLLDRRDVEEATKQLEAVDRLWDTARKRWSTREWEDDWTEWTELRDKLRNHMDELTSPPVPPKRKK
jgi:tetratricopeptide (TPR) repeat protein